MPRRISPSGPSYQFAFAPGFPLSTAFDDGQRLVADTRAMPYAAYRETMLSKERYVERKPHDTRLRDLGLPASVIFGERGPTVSVRGVLPSLSRRAGCAGRGAARGGAHADGRGPDATASLVRDFLR